MLILPILTFDTKEKRDKFTAIYACTNKMLYGYAYSILKDQDLAEDATHEAFLRLSKNLDKVGDSSCTRTINFMITIVKNVSFTLLKKTAKESIMKTDNQEVLFPADLPTPEDYCVRQECYNQLHEAINQLSDTYRETIKLKYFNELSDAEIAEVQGITENNVYVRLCRAHKLLLDALKKGVVGTNE